MKRYQLFVAGLLLLSLFGLPVIGQLQQEQVDLSSRSLYRAAAASSAAPFAKRAFSVPR